MRGFAEGIWTSGENDACNIVMSWRELTVSEEKGKLHSWLHDGGEGGDDGSGATVQANAPQGW